MQPARVLVLLLVLLVIIQCGTAPPPSLKREELFSLSLGNLENQIDLFMIDGVPASGRNTIYLKSGRIYVANGNASKIMELTPFGDLVFLLYNGETNPQPVVLRRQEETANRRATAYPFRNLGRIVVDGEKRLYVEDQVAPLQSRYDEKTGVTHSAQVLRFDRDGNLLDYLGQEGVGGTPFPHIESLAVSAKDEPVVVCRIPPERWLVYWFARDGSLLFRVEVDRESLPGSGDAIPFLEKILVDYEARQLLFAVTYYHEDINPSTRTLESVSEVGARVYRFDVERNAYLEHMDLPSAGTRTERVGATELQIPSPSFALLGNTKTGHLVLLRPEDTDRYLLVILDPRGREVARRIIAIEDTELTFKDMELSEDGTVVGLLGLEDGARVVWWRSDKLIGGERP